MLPFEIKDFTGKSFVCEFNANRNKYKIIRSVLSQKYGCLTIKEVTYKNGIKYLEKNKYFELQRIKEGLKTGYYKELI